MLKNMKKLLNCTKPFSLMLLLSAATHIEADQTSQPNNPLSKANEQLDNLNILIEIEAPEEIQTEAPKLDSAKLEELEKDLKETRFNLGNCKNKNMSNEVLDVELLQEIEELKKELKAC